MDSRADAGWTPSIDIKDPCIGPYMDIGSYGFSRFIFKIVIITVRFHQSIVFWTSARLHDSCMKTPQITIEQTSSFTKDTQGCSWGHHGKSQMNQCTCMCLFGILVRFLFALSGLVCVLVSGREALMTSVMHASFAQTRSPQQTHDQPYQVHPQTDSPRHTPTQVDNCIYT